MFLPAAKWSCKLSCIETISLAELIDFTPSLFSIYHFQAHSFGVPPVIVDSTPHSHPHPPSGGLKTGYFPPTNRVMPRVSRES